MAVQVKIRGRTGEDRCTGRVQLTDDALAPTPPLIEVRCTLTFAHMEAHQWSKDSVTITWTDPVVNPT